MIDEKVKLHCTDNGKDLDGHILSYKPKAYLEVAVQTLKIRMAYQERTKVFVGSVGGKEFVLKESNLPTERKEFSRK
jgi:hypothetical protein